MRSYRELIAKPASAPSQWQVSCTHDESTFHQLSPYIGKLKSSIASDLIEAYTRRGALVADLFCGSGTVPLECVNLERRVFAADANYYAVILTKGKLFAPETKEEALRVLDRALAASSGIKVDLRSVPPWVRSFYHPDTLKEVLALCIVLKKRREYFILSCLLGILHHQRPGFLSYPSSHLVPYLRTKKFPRKDYPSMYEYRNLDLRIREKVKRAYKRTVKLDKKLVLDVRRSSIERLTPPTRVDCFITSPPYMNALDYGRDNRLRNWFLGEANFEPIDSRLSGILGFRRIMKAYAGIVAKTLVVGGRCIFVVGEKTQRKEDRFPSEVVAEVMGAHAPDLAIREIVSDRIPDVRRSRRNLSGVKLEHILVYERVR